MCAQETCCQGQHTYVHAQQMLGALAQHPNGARFRRLAQELELHAGKRWGAPVWQMHAWCVAACRLSLFVFHPPDLTITNILHEKKHAQAHVTSRDTCISTGIQTLTTCMCAGLHQAMHHCARQTV